MNKKLNAPQGLFTFFFLCSGINFDFHFFKTEYSTVTVTWNYCILLKFNEIAH